MSNNRIRTALVSEIKVETEIFINAVSLSDKTLAEVNQLLSIWGMTLLQYNALSVLYEKDKNNKGLPSKEIGLRLYTRVPDVTRLLDRLADKGWIIRERDPDNRRIVRSSLTTIGIELVESVNPALQELESKQFSSLTKKEKKLLADLLIKALDED